MLDRILWQSPQSLPAALAAGVILVLALFWLYQSQLRMLPGPWNWVVPGLRLAAVIVILGAILKPVIVRLRAPWEQGAVVVLIDRSRSMSVVDTHRSPANRIAVADALGALAAGTRSIVSADLRSRAQSLGPLVDAIAAARSEVEYAQLSGRGTDAADARLRDATAAFISTSNGLRQDAADRGKAGRFLEACDDLISLFNKAEKSQANWINHLRQRVDTVVNASGEFQNASDAELYRTNADTRIAADQLAGESRLALVNRAISDPVAGLLANLPPSTSVLALGAEPALPSIPLASTSTTQPAADGAESDLNGAIAAVRQKFGGQAIQAVVLFSDGRQVGGSGGGAPSLDVPLFAVGVADSFRRDVAIARFDVPNSVFIGETAMARVELAATGVKDQPVDVTLTADGKSQTQHVILNEGRTPVAFPIKADSSSTLDVTVSINGLPDDVTAAGSRAQRRIKVLSDKIAVAIIGGSAGWDYQYLRNALQRTAWIRCRDEIVRKDIGPLRMSPDDILSQQVVILDDVDPSALNAGQWDAVGKLVSERGGGAIIIAGDDVLPARLSQQPVLADLLPWPVSQAPVWQTWSGESPGYRLLPPVGDVTDAIKLSNDPEENQRRWDQLPAIYRILPVMVAKPNVRSLLVEAESGQPVLTEGRVGVGRSIFFGANETWRWRYKIGERDQDRFWLQLVRQAGEAPYAYHDQTMALDIDNISPTPTQTVHVRARILDGQGRPAPGAIFPAIRVESAGADVMTVPLRGATPGVDTGRYVAELPGMPKGTYDVQLMVGGQPTKLSAPLDVEVNYEAEMADVSGDDGNLRRLAGASGGEFLGLEQVRDLPGKLSAARERRPQSIEYPLWDSPYLYLFVLGCLGGEWALRKQFGLV